MYSVCYFDVEYVKTFFYKLQLQSSPMILHFLFHHRISRRRHIKELTGFSVCFNVQSVSRHGKVATRGQTKARFVHFILYQGVVHIFVASVGGGTGFLKAVISTQYL